MDQSALFRHANLPLLLLQARECVIARFRPLLKAHGLSEQQWRIIRALLALGPMEPRQIVDVCGISSPSLTGVLARMDELGLVRRERFDADARRLKVTLTPRSRNLARRLAPQIEAVYSEIEARIGSEFTRGLYNALDMLIASLGTAEETQEEAPNEARQR